ncbi:MAG: DUF4272 domain-containing protein [Lachnospiraceae bacterium]|nr:DUF4272 domain-containing protein [Lachnospiraceae bacterium]MDE7271581.1 DUF4272 domain-containing protein [Lachnospiraceae bacterium]
MELVTDNYNSGGNDFKEAQMRKERSIEILKAHKVPYIEHLPVMETANMVRVRTAEEIARRAVACLFAIQVACDAAGGRGSLKKSRQFFSEKLVEFGVEGVLTHKEQKVFCDKCTDQEFGNMTWKYEAYWVLLWALGIVEKLDYPAEACDCDFAINAVADCNGMKAFMAKIRMRDIDEILDEADLIFRYDWACVDARIHEDEAPAGLNPDVVYERHCGFNWLIDADGADDWDNVATNT